MKDNSRTVRRSVALPARLAEEATRLAPGELRDNLDSLVVVSPEEYVKQRRAIAFGMALAEMAADPAIQPECDSIAAEFAGAERDGLKHD
jgi:hypothetical protein